MGGKGWPLEWKRIKRGPAVCSHTAARETRRTSTFYIVETWAENLPEKARFALARGGRSGQSFFIYGEKGTGKTLLVEWMASQLSLPIYYLDLRSKCLNDTTLQVAITAGKLRHCSPVIFHFDEFQSSMRAFMAPNLTATHTQGAPGSEAGVTIQGLQGAIEGLGTPHALFIFTSSQPLPCLEGMSDLGTRQEWRGLMRRLHDPWRIPPIDEQSAARYLDCFLDTYLGTISDITALPERTSKLVEAWAVHEGALPLDMLAKYCHSRLCDAHAAGLVAVEADGVRVLPQHGNSFVGMLFENDVVRDWQGRYAGGGLGEPACKRRRLASDSTGPRDD